MFRNYLQNFTKKKCEKFPRTMFYKRTYEIRTLWGWDSKCSIINTITVKKDRKDHMKVCKEQWPRYAGDSVYDRNYTCSEYNLQRATKCVKSKSKGCDVNPDLKARDLLKALKLQNKECVVPMKGKDYDCRPHLWRWLCFREQYTMWYKNMGTDRTKGSLKWFLNRLNNAGVRPRGGDKNSVHLLDWIRMLVKKYGALMNAKKLPGKNKYGCRVTRGGKGNYWKCPTQP